jgi:hypothetical protein
MKIPSRVVISELNESYAEKLFELAAASVLPKAVRQTLTLAGNEILMLRKMLDTSRSLHSDAVSYIEELEVKMRGRGRHAVTWGSSDNDAV